MGTGITGRGMGSTLYQRVERRGLGMGSSRRGRAAVLHGLAAGVGRAGLGTLERPAPSGQRQESLPYLDNLQKPLHFCEKKQKG